MKTIQRLIFYALIIGFVSCGQPSGNDENTTSSETPVKPDSIFKQVADFPLIKDSALFIADLRKLFDLDVDESPLQKESEEITAFQKIKLYGSDDDFFFIEYDYKVGIGAAFPYKYQLILSSTGKPVKSLAGLRYELVGIFKNENPFLLTITSTSKGNGGHQLYKISADSLENLLDDAFDSLLIQTYDTHDDKKVYEPNELVLKIKDFNKDGFNDISFHGEIVYTQAQTASGDWVDTEIRNGKTIAYSIDHPFKKVPVEFTFLYDTPTGHFKPKENYFEKFKLDE